MTPNRTECARREVIGQGGCGPFPGFKPRILPSLWAIWLLSFGLVGCSAQRAADTPPPPQAAPLGKTAIDDRKKEDRRTAQASTPSVPVTAAEPRTRGESVPGGELSVQVNHGWGESGSTASAWSRAVS